MLLRCAWAGVRRCGKASGAAPTWKESVRQLFCESREIPAARLSLRNTVSGPS